MTPVGCEGEIEHLIERAWGEVTIMTEDEMASLLEWGCGGPSPATGEMGRTALYDESGTSL